MNVNTKGHKTIFFNVFNKVWQHKRNLFTTTDTFSLIAEFN